MVTALHCRQHWCDFFLWLLKSSINSQKPSSLGVGRGGGGGGDYDSLDQLTYLGAFLPSWVTGQMYFCSSGAHIYEEQIASLIVVIFLNGDGSEKISMYGVQIGLAGWCQCV